MQNGLCVRICPGPPVDTPSGSENTPAETGNSPSPPKLLDQVRDQLRLRHYSIRTEAQYIHWVKRFILFHHKRHPREMGATEVEAFPYAQLIEHFSYAV